jgi:amino acid permease
MGFFKSFVLPTSLLAGTVIGAGIFSLPYVFERSGVGLGFIFLAIFALLYCIIHLMYADLVIKNGDQHRFAGFVRMYFGNSGYWLSVIMTVIEMFFVLTIYLVLSSSFVSLVFPTLPKIFQVIVFWWIGSIIIFSGTKRLTFFELLAIAGIIGAIAAVTYFGFQQFFEKSLLFAAKSPLFWLLPFGPLLFSLSGRPAIPSLIHYFNRNLIDPIKSKKAIIWGTIIPAITYAAFVVGILGASGAVTADSVTGFVESTSSYYIVFILAILGILSLVSSYFAIGLDVFRSLEFDLKFSRKLSMFLVVSLPLFIYFMNLGSFITLVEIAGGIFVGLEGIIITAMWTKMRAELQRVGYLKQTLVSTKSLFVRYGLYGVFGISVIYVFLFQIFRF